MTIRFLLISGSGFHSSVALSVNLLKLGFVLLGREVGVRGGGVGAEGGGMGWLRGARGSGNIVGFIFGSLELVRNARCCFVILLDLVGWVTAFVDLVQIFCDLLNLAIRQHGISHLACSSALFDASR